MTQDLKEKIKQPSVFERLRRCLSCGHKFPSEGPHNHVCRRCKNTQAWRQGF